jgi:hypothetical protein
VCCWVQTKPYRIGLFFKKLTDHCSITGINKTEVTDQGLPQRLSSTCNSRTDLMFLDGRDRFFKSESTLTFSW